MFKLYEAGLLDEANDVTTTVKTELKHYELNLKKEKYSNLDMFVWCVCMYF